jgi:hypothetical protein
MSTSPSSAPSPSISKSEYYSSLPWFRRLLATLNWRPDYDIEQETERMRMRSLESEKQIVESEKRLKHLRNETEQLKNESEQLKIENARLAALESKLDLLLLSADSSSPIPPATDCN